MVLFHYDILISYKIVVHCTKRHFKTIRWFLTFLNNYFLSRTRTLNNLYSTHYTIFVVVIMTKNVYLCNLRIQFVDNIKLCQYISYYIITNNILLIL